ncbi:MAG: hypothetical protein JO316_02380 [Abitibacteriaceae bacterium]|nr:hypothetical protein [Abditibacteriaceae bacterium]
MLRRRIQLLLTLFIIGLVLSGITAFPLQWELNLLAKWLGATDRAVPADYTGLTHWIVRVRNGLRETYAFYPFIAYGTDWLAFAHLVIAVAFIGPLRDPVRNVWVLTFGLIACLGVIPLALICGPLRGIPFYWRLIDCSFGIAGSIPLWLCWRYTQELSCLEPWGVPAPQPRQ